jgi:uncharacterized cupredoxin-like copper-binding protein
MKPHIIAIAAAGVFVAVSGCGHDRASPQQPITTASGGQEISVALSDFRFTPATIVLEQNRPYRITLRNEGSGKHDLTAPDFFHTVQSSRPLPADGKVVLAKGEIMALDIVPTQKGTYPFECSVFLHALFGMEGKFVVE